MRVEWTDGVGKLVALFAVIGGLLFSSALFNCISSSHNKSTAEQMHGSAVLTRDESTKFSLLAEKMQLYVTQVQQYLTDVSATHDSAGYAKASEYADRFRDGVRQFSAMYQKENDQENLARMGDLSRDFEKFYKDGAKMAAAYVDEGTEAGNLAMSAFDEDSKTLCDAVAVFTDAQVKELTQAMNGIERSSKAIQDKAGFSFASNVVIGLLGLAVSLLAAYVSITGVKKSQKAAARAKWETDNILTSI
ncbi:MAG: hypothetical protein V2A77_06475, partial [Pseudomonadota bacterium]